MGRAINPKSKVLPVTRVTPALYEAIIYRAEKAQVTVAEYIRRVLVQHLSVRPDAQQGGRS